MLWNWLTETHIIGIPDTVALASIALLGYMFGRRTRSLQKSNADHLADLGRAARIAIQLESIADTLRENLAMHHAQVADFQQQLNDAQGEAVSDSWKELCEETDAILAPTLELADQLTRAYDHIRQQSQALQEFTAGRTDPVTGAGNRQALVEQMEAQMSDMRDGKPGFALALIAIDHPKQKQNKPAKRADDSQLQHVARVTQLCMRDTDFIARYGDDEFAVLMPQASLAGAGIFGDRVRKKIRELVDMTVSCGIAEAQSRDKVKTLLARADSALYSAKAAGKSSQFAHTGTKIRTCDSRPKAGKEDVPPIEYPTSVPGDDAAAATLEEVGAP